MIKDNNSKWRDGQEFIFPVVLVFYVSTKLDQLHIAITTHGCDCLMVHRPLCLATLNTAFKIAFATHFFHSSLGESNLT